MPIIMNFNLFQELNCFADPDRVDEIYDQLHDSDDEWFYESQSQGVEHQELCSDFWFVEVQFKRIRMQQY